MGLMGTVIKMDKGGIRGARRLHLSSGSANDSLKADSGISISFENIGIRVGVNE